MLALIDCNNFFASCEEVFNPRLKNKPLLILSRNDGCVIARSKKAKELGIKMGEPAYLYKGRKDIEILSSNFTLYADMSHRVMRTLESFSPNMEIYSVDEAFFQLGPKSDDEYLALANAIRAKVFKWTGIPISVGIAPTKTLAKVANETAKKGTGVCLLSTSTQIEKRLCELSPQEIWGIGSHLALRLKKEKIYTAWQLASLDDTRIRKLLGLGGYQTALELRGVPCFGLLEEPEKKKSIVCSRSFSQKIETIELLEEAVASFASHAAEKLREQKSLASFLSVFIATSPFEEPYFCPSSHFLFPNPTSFTPDLIREAKRGLLKIFQKGYSYKRAGVLLGEFTDLDAQQIDGLTSDPVPEKKKQAMHIIDQINSSYDKQAIRFAAVGVERRWKSASAHVTPRFTTCWNELLVVK